VTIHWALRAVRQERMADLRRGLIATAVLAVVFLAVQTPSLIELLGEHQQYRTELREQTDSGQRASLALQPYGMVFFLIVVHAAHLIGGIIPLGVVTRNALRNRYDHESYNPVRYTAMYWHFLDAVWLTLFAMFLLVG
jgi:cytochrome c oxidase subunit III